MARTHCVQNSGASVQSRGRRESSACGRREMFSPDPCPTEWTRVMKSVAAEASRGRPSLGSVLAIDGTARSLKCPLEKVQTRSPTPPLALGSQVMIGEAGTTTGSCA